MKIWIYLYGVQEGPYTIDELRRRPVTPDTPVWYEGLPDWTIAGMAPATAALFAPPPPPQPLPPLPNACAQTQTPDEPAPDVIIEEVEVGTEVVDEPVESQICDPAEPTAEPAAPQPVAQVWPQWQQPAEPRPDTFLVWSILLTVVCCNPLSIAAIVTGVLCNTRYNSGDYAGARRMSTVTEWLIMLGVVLGVLALPLLFLVAVWS